MTREEVLSLKDGDVVNAMVPGACTRLIIRRPKRMCDAQTSAAWIECDVEHPSGNCGIAVGGITDDRGLLRWNTTMLVKPVALPKIKGFKRIAK